MIRLLLMVTLLLAGREVMAQGFDMSHGSSELQISADDGLEWQSDASRVIAHGNAKAVRGDMTVTADTLTAYYRSGSGDAAKTAAPAGSSPSGGNQIWRVDADGHVTITNPTDVATGDKAIYDLDKAVLILKGAPAKLTTPSEIFTADEQLEYWEDQHMAVLRSNAVAISKDKKIQADVLTAHFKDQKQGAKTQKSANGGTGGGNMELQRADAFGHVILTTPKDKATGDRGDYNADSGIATLTGIVTLTRDNNIMNGRYAHVDMNSGVSTLYGFQPDESKQRVQATFVPAQHNEEKPKP